MPYSVRNAVCIYCGFAAEIAAYRGGVVEPRCEYCENALGMEGLPRDAELGILTRRRIILSYALAGNLVRRYAGQFLLDIAAGVERSGALAGEGPPYARPEGAPLPAHWVRLPGLGPVFSVQVEPGQSWGVPEVTEWRPKLGGKAAPDRGGFNVPSTFRAAGT